MMKKEISTALIALVIAVPLSTYVIGQQELNAKAHKYDLKPAPVTYIVELQEAPSEVMAEPTETEYFDVPLSEELQDHIFAECEKHDISPALVIAMIERESSFRASVKGDDGCSMGLMQIQKKWHEERMQKLGCDDLLDPFQNVTVGVDFLAELMNIHEDLYWVLMAYNGGFKYANKRMEEGNISTYAFEIVERAMLLERGEF